MLTLTSPVETRLHRWSAAVKLGLLALFTFSLFLLPIEILALCAAAVCGAYLLLGLRFARHGLRMLRPLWPFILLVAVWHYVTDDLHNGLAILLRMTTAVAAANLVTMTTRLSDMIPVLEWVCRPLAPILPPRRLALALALVIRFVPVLSEKSVQLSEAYRARSGRKRAGLAIIAPLALAALDDAERVAEALRARGGTG